MFKSEYQGGPTVEVLSAQGKDPLNRWKISGIPNTLKRTYDKDVKSNIFSFEGSTTTCKLQLPKDTKQSLYLTQRYLTIQLYIPEGKDLSVELIMTDKGNSKRRLLISTTVRENSVTPLHAKLNLGMIKRHTWLNLCFDMASLIEDTFPKQSFKTLDSISLAGTCKVRRIFTMRNQPPDTNDADSNSTDSINGIINYSQLENIPPALQFSSTIQYVTQVITVPKIRAFIRPVTTARTEARESTSGYWSSSSDDLSNSFQGRSNKEQGHAVVAFGSTIRVDKSKSKSVKNNFAPRERKISSSSISGNSTNRSSVNPRSARKLKSSSMRHISEKDTPSNAKSSQGQMSVINIEAGDMPMPHKPETPRKKDSEHRFKKPLTPVKNIKAINKTEKEQKNGIQTEHGNQDIPASLVNLVDEMDDYEYSNQSEMQQDVSTDFHTTRLNESEVFMFSSRPHSTSSRKRDDSESSISINEMRKNDVSLDKDFEKSDSSSYDSDEDIQKRIIRNTPSPRSKVLSSRIERNTFSPPDGLLSAKSHHSDMDERFYDSKKYKEPTKSLVKDHSAIPSASPQRALNKSVISLRSSDATLTGSVDTLVQNSINITIENDNSVNDDSLNKSKTPEPNSNEPTQSLNSPLTDSNYLHVNTSPRAPSSNSQHSVTVSRKSLRELPNGGPSNPTSPRTLATVPEFLGYKVGDLSDSMEADMLASLKREQEEEMIRDREETSADRSARRFDTGGKYDNEDNLSGDESFDTSWSTWKQPPQMYSSAYKDEMEGSSPVPKMTDTLLGLSLGKQNTNMWGNFSPPSAQEREGLSDADSGGDVFGLSDGSTVSGKSTSTGVSDDEEMLDLMYDPCLNCYFDPKTQRYYELKG